MIVLFMTALALYGCAAVLPLILTKYQRAHTLLSNLLQAAASCCTALLALGRLNAAGPALKLLDISSPIPYLTLTLKLDKLSAFFLLCLAVLSLSVSIYSIGYMKHYFDKLNTGLFHCFVNVFIVSMFFVLTAADLVSFLIAWEIMSLVSYALVVFETKETENSKAGLLYIIMTHLGAAFLIIAFMLLYVHTGSLEIAAAGGLSTKVKNILFVLFLLGFGVKAGLIPLHVWLPYAHPVALSNISALMSGIMIKTAVYGLLRFILVVLGASETWWGVVILLLGAVAATLGIAYALLENNYKRLLAYSSIENIGIILIGLGVALAASAGRHPAVAALALLASLFHVLNHTLFKGALFLGAGSLHYALQTKNIEKLGGLMKKMPFTGVLMLLAALAISALPPFNGFVSEWLTFQSIFQFLNVSGTGAQLLGMLSAAALALTGGLGAACFVKLIGISFLGLPRSPEAEEAREAPAPMLFGMGILVFLCLLLGIFPRAMAGLLDGINQELLQISILPAIKGSIIFIYYPLQVGGTAISPVFVLAGGLVLLIICLTVIHLLHPHSNQRLYETWDCGFGGLNSRMQYTATGFSKPLRIVFRTLYRPKRVLEYKEGLSPYY
ncbi:MAG: proton-conducting transporter membrane subunit, partial [Clostridia bacterium]|nr:proton-conducting transporter membrane subunit [Clostridia bacterium]